MLTIKTRINNIYYLVGTDVKQYFVSGNKPTIPNAEKLLTDLNIQHDLVLIVMKEWKTLELPYDQFKQYLIEE